MNKSLEHVYGTHHAKRRGEGFMLAGEARGAFLSSAVGTGKRVLDIGCRDGALTTFFVTGNRVLGTDIDSQALGRAHASLGIDTEQADLNGPWPFPDSSFDAIVGASTRGRICRERTERVLAYQSPPLPCEAEEGHTDGRSNAYQPLH